MQRSSLIVVSGLGLVAAIAVGVWVYFATAPTARSLGGSGVQRVDVYRYKSGGQTATHAVSGPDVAAVCDRLNFVVQPARLPGDVGAATQIMALTTSGDEFTSTTSFVRMGDRLFYAAKNVRGPVTEVVRVSTGTSARPGTRTTCPR